MAASAVISVLLVSGVITALLLPKLDYLPDGNRNLIIGYVMPPSGYNLKTMTEIATKSEKATEPLWNIEEKTKKFQSINRRYNDFFRGLSSKCDYWSRSHRPI